MPIAVGVNDQGVVTAEPPIPTRLFTAATMHLRCKLAHPGVETGEVLGGQLRRFGGAEDEFVFRDEALFSFDRLDLSIDPAAFDGFIGLLDTRRCAGNIAALAAPEVRVVGAALSAWAVRPKCHLVFSP